MIDRIYCLDTSVFIRYLTTEDQADTAMRVVLAALDESSLLVAPAWAWAEVGSVLRKKARDGELQEAEAGGLWRFFIRLSVEFLNEEQLQLRSWELADQYGLSAIYDAAFLACTELAEPATVPREFWTADKAFVRQLGSAVPSYVRLLTS